MKKLVTILLIILFNSAIYSQPAKPNKVGQFGDFVGVVKFGGMLEGTSMFTIYSEVIRAEVTFFSGDGIANPPKVNYGRYFELINDIYSYGADRRPYVVAVKAKSVLQKNWGRGGFDLVWTPIKITLISTSSSLEGPNDEHKLEAKTKDIKLESLSPNVKLDIIGKSIKIGNLEIMNKDLEGTMYLPDAEKIATDKGDRWRVPTIEELKLLYKNRYEIGGFNNDRNIDETIYMSSTEAYGGGTFRDIKVLHFDDGVISWGFYAKGPGQKVRLIRTFK